MKCFSLFSGIGGFDLALTRLGHEIVGACEIDKYARSIYQRHFPGVPVHDDATTLQAESLPHFDLLCGGFPCQAFSIAGRRLGFDDPRGNLFFEIARIAKSKRPRYLFLENVKGLLNHEKGDTFRTILQTLDEMGYDAEWQVINGKYFLPQNRERIFIIGHLRGERTRQIFPLGEISEVNAGTRQETQGKGKRIRSQMVTAIDANYAKGGGSRTMIKYYSNSESQSYRIYDINGVCPTLGSSENMSKPIIKTKDMRSLTPTECERLQGFPDGWTEGISDRQRYKCLGNAVMVPKIEYIARNLK